MEYESVKDDGQSPSEINSGLPWAFEAPVALIGLILIAPLIGLAALATVMSSRGPIFFRQERVGRQGRTFRLCKLRTMRVANQGLQVTAGDDNRITAVGRILRKTKMDELPALWNIVKGEMSLVGPRPEVPRYVDLQNPTWRLVLEARPGITDPMTLRLRNEETLMMMVDSDREQFYLQTLQPFKLRGYLDYLQTRSWRSDLRVIWQTLAAVIFPSKAPLPTLEEIRRHAIAPSTKATN